MGEVPTPHEGPTTGEPAPAFQRKISLFDATMLVAGTMIGSGIFLVSADIARDVGTSGWLMAVWLLTGIMTVMGALSYAELAAMMPHAGGQYVFLREAFSPLWGFLYGWTVFWVIQTGSIAAVAVAFAKFLSVWVPKLGSDQIVYSMQYHVPAPLRDILSLAQLKVDAEGVFTVSAAQCVAVVVVAVLTWINCLGVREGTWVQNLFTLAKSAALVALIVIGLTIARNAVAVESNLSQPWITASDTPKLRETLEWFPAASRGSTGILVLAFLMVVAGTMTGSLFSADAWNNVTFTAGEVTNPKRNVALSMTLGASLVIVLYLLANVSYLAALPLEGFAAADSVFRRGIAHARGDLVATAVMEQAYPAWGPRLMALAIMVSTFGCVNGMVLMGGRLYYAMAADRLFFKTCGRLNRHGVPAAALVLQGIWSAVLVFSGSYNQLLDYVMFAALLFYVLTIIGLFVLRRTRPDAERPYRAFGYPLVPALYILLCALITLDLLVVKAVFAWRGFILVLTGIPAYLIWNWARSRRTRPG